jgi:phosphopantothenoylcysteine decarboxylase/phosphopantothenate--cysteine ligase
MAEPENIVAFIQNLLFLANKNELLGKKVVVTAGTTHEYIDPVRYIANASTGKMGYAIAEAFAQRGASVTLISGPATAKVSHPNVQKISVITALEMLEATQNHYQQADIAVFAAAVADYRVAHQAVEKIKKKEENLTLELIKNPDIAAEMGKLKKPNQYNIGFALETHNPVENALKKLVGKNFNLVVLNSLQDEGAGFGYDTNKVTFIEADKQTVLPLKSKTDIAMDIVEKVINEYVVK